MLTAPDRLPPTRAWRCACFGGRVSERLTALLRPMRSLGLLGQIGDIVVATETGDSDFQA